jgi:hypothetical protein
MDTLAVISIALEVATTLIVIAIWFSINKDEK